jgi:transcriptional regulator with XRE-family HTH domain
MRSMSGRIRQARNAKALTQAGLALALGVGRSAVAQWERVGGSRPSSANLATLAATLNCSFEWLATGRGLRDTDPGKGGAVILADFARDAAEDHVLHAFRGLNERDKAIATAVIDLLATGPKASRRALAR